MTAPDPEQLLSAHRLPEPSTSLKSRVLGAAAEAWPESETQEASTLATLTFRTTQKHSWWRFAAAAALLFATGLNVIHAAVNRAAAQPAKAQSLSAMSAAESLALANRLNLEPGELRGMIRFGHGSPTKDTP